MKKIVWGFVLAGALQMNGGTGFAAVAPGASTAAATSASTMTVGQLLSRNVAARGGAEAWRKVSTMVMKGQMDAGKGMQVPYVMDLKRGRKVRVEIVFDGKTAIQAYDGVHGWKLRPFLGRHEVEPFTADEEASSAMDADLDGLLIGYELRGTRIDLEGQDQVEGHKAYRLKLVSKDGQIRRVWLDSASYLEIKLQGTRRMDGKMKPVDTFLRDYRTVEGLKVPFLYETVIEGVKASGSIHVDSVAINAPLQDTLFAKLQ